MSACYCDVDEYWKVYNKTNPIARKQHKCNECGAPIMPGQRYEYVFGLLSDGGHSYKTCQHCTDARDYLKAHVPCFCWYHGNLAEDIRNTLDAYAHEAPGLAFAIGRFFVKSRRAKNAAQEAKT